MANASTRAWIRWPPGNPYESTSTLVLSSGSPENYFVDIRVKTPGNQESLKAPALKSVMVEAVSLDALDWAFAGVSERTELTRAQEIDHGIFNAERLVAKGRWYHHVDSKTRIGEKPIDDEGDLYSYDTPEKHNVAGEVTLELELEKGRMLNPLTGKIQDYEELWASIDMNEDDGTPSRLPLGTQYPGCLVMKASNDKDITKQGMIIMIGKWCQGVMRIGEDFIVERWAKGASKDWKCLVKIGKGQLPDPTALRELDVKSEGSIVVLGGITWIVEVSR